MMNDRWIAGDLPAICQVYRVDVNWTGQRFAGDLPANCRWINFDNPYHDRISSQCMLIFICSAIISLSMSKRPKNSPATKRGPGPRYPWASPGLYVQFLKVCKDLKEDLKSPTAAVFQKIAEGIKSAGFPEPTNDQVRSKMRQQKVISDLEKFAAVEILRTSCICLCWHGAEALIEDETADRLPEGDDDEVVLHPTGWSLEVPPRLYHVLRHGGYKIEAEHSAGEEFITLHWRLQTPTLSEMKERYQNFLTETDIYIDFHQIFNLGSTLLILES